MTINKYTVYISAMYTGQFYIKAESPEAAEELARASLGGDVGQLEYLKGSLQIDDIADYEEQIGK